MSTTNPANDRNGVQVIRRAAQILRVLKDHPEGMSLSQIAERTSLARSTVHRLVAALEQELLVSSTSPNGGFRLGSALSSLAASADRNFALDFHPVLSKLSRDLNETVDVAVLENDHVRFVHQIGAAQRLRAVSAIGAIFPAYCTANGKALLALLPDEHVMKLLPEHLEKFTPNTITDRAEILRSLAEVRKTGIAFDREEHTMGICAVGIAVEDPGARPVAITVPLPASRFHGNEARLVKALKAAKVELEEIIRQSPGVPN